METALIVNFWVISVTLVISVLTNTAAGYAPKPDYRPETKFERRGLKLGHGVWDLVFRRNDVPVADAPPVAAGADSLSDQ